MWQQNISFQCVIADEDAAVLVIMKNTATIHSMPITDDTDMKLTIRYFLVQNDVIITNESSEVELDDEVITLAGNITSVAKACLCRKQLEKVCLHIFIESCNYRMFQQ